MLLAMGSPEGRPLSPGPGAGSVVLRKPGPGGRRRYVLLHDPEAVLEARCPGDVLPLLEEVERAVGRGLHAAGFLCYEAARAFDPAFSTRPPGPLPLAWFGLYRDEEDLRLAGGELGGFALGEWRATVSEPGYLSAIARIKDAIARGDTYQVNYCHRLRAQFQGSAWALFQTLVWRQPAPHAAFVELGEHALCSTSPELFFRLSGSHIQTRPMKGTAPRGPSSGDDLAQAERLSRSAKDQAENLMIVDMVRNDLGRIARTGSVEVPRLFEVEQYRTLWQLTSTVQAETDARLPQILAALFPSASITGAPKVSTMQLIADLEDTPRGAYTGAIGWLSPGRQAEFNVAIRTVWVDSTRGEAEYGTGGGIVWDSVPAAEYAECRTKSLVLTSRRQAFRLLETLLWEPDQGFFLLSRHLDRLRSSARYFGFRVPEDVAARLLGLAAGLSSERFRVRLLLDEDGDLEMDAGPLAAERPLPWRVGLAREPVAPEDVFLFHKTTHRAVYEAARLPDRDDVLLWNTRGELTESTLANLVLKLDGRLLTPHATCGLLPGTFRAHLLETGEIAEAVLRKPDLERASAVYLINSVRRWIPVTLSRV